MYGKDRITIHDRREMLRVKLKSLAAESKIIRHEERRTNGQLRNELWFHRIHAVRSEARHTHLAYGLIRGMAWSRIEQRCDAPPDWKRVIQMAKKYGPSPLVIPAGMPEAFDKALAELAPAKPTLLKRIFA